MSRYAKDAELNAIAGRLRDAHFDDTGEIAGSIFDRHDQGERWRAVYSLPMVQRCFVVRLSVGGVQRSLGFSTNISHAVRFADMCIVRFWKYRMRGGPIATDADVNTTVESAQRDLVNEEEASLIITRLEQYLQGINALPIIEGVENIRTVRRRAAHQDRLTMHGEILSALSGVQRSLGDLVAQLEKKGVL